jgi:hypothetical protein
LRYAVALVLLCAAIASARGRGSGMEIVYERSGGLAGLRERLSIREGTLAVSERGTKTGERTLTVDEQKRVDALLAELSRAGEPVASDENVADAFQVMLFIDGPTRVTTRSVTLPAAGLGKSWDEALRWLDALLSSELRSMHPDRPNVLGPDEL